MRLAEHKIMQWRVCPRPGARAAMLSWLKCIMIRTWAVMSFCLLFDAGVSAQVVPSIVPGSYEQLMAYPTAGMLDTPSNIRAVTTFDVASGHYVITMYIGEMQAGIPFRLTPDQYNRWQTRLAMQQNLRKSGVGGIRDTARSPLDFLAVDYSAKPLERVFGKGGVRLSTRGNVAIKTGVRTTKTDNPALALKSRRKTYFDFDQRIQANVNASVGTRLKFGFNYNTDATFDFDSKNIKLAYEGEEDDIIK
ncbi:MAG: hypothetical protein K2J42_06470 [Muribaculaceae bacterium]|nr:hypothetical protein [Muribaculaceae bacterium]